MLQVVTNARRIDSRYWATSAGSAPAGATLASDTGVIHIASGRVGPRSASIGGEDGPISTGIDRRWTWRRMSMQTLVAIRYSQERTLERPSKPSALRHARSIVSWTASSASKPEPSMR